MGFESDSSQIIQSLSLHSNGTSQNKPSNPDIHLEIISDQTQTPLEDVASHTHFGLATSPGGRSYQDDRSTAFSTTLPDGRRASIAAVLDGHHGHDLSDLVVAQLPYAFRQATLQSPCSSQKTDIADVLAATIRLLDDQAYDAFTSKEIPTGGTTMILHVLVGDTIFTANIGDCKSVLSSRGAPEPLSRAHNPPVDTERQRFAEAGIPCFSDHIGGSDINVCRTIGDYDQGPPLKWRDEGGMPRGPLSCIPEITFHTLDDIDEFIVVASDGLWDYYTPESSVITEARRKLRASNNDTQACAEWLVQEALQKQRMTLHEGTPGDNVTVMIVQVRNLPDLPRTSESRLNLRRRSSSEVGASSPTDANTSSGISSRIDTILGGISNCISTTIGGINNSSIGSGSAGDSHSDHGRAVAPPPPHSDRNGDTTSNMSPQYLRRLLPERLKENFGARKQ